MNDHADNRDETAAEYTGPRSTPQTDPTNPYRQESVGVWVAAERTAVRRDDEPGLTDHDRQLRKLPWQP